MSHVPNEEGGDADDENMRSGLQDLLNHLSFKAVWDKSFTTPTTNEHDSDSRDEESKEEEEEAATTSTNEHDNNIVPEDSKAEEGKEEIRQNPLTPNKRNKVEESKEEESKEEEEEENIEIYYESKEKVQEEQTVDEEEEEKTSNKDFAPFLSGIYQDEVELGGELIDFLNDEPQTMTYGHRIALYLMERYKWYNPKLDTEQVDTPLVDSLTVQETETNHGAEEESAQEFSTSIETENRENEESEVGVLNKTASTAASEEYETAADSVHSADGGPSKSITNDDDLEVTQVETPSLEKAWAYFEHMILPRYIFHPKEKVNKSRAKRIVRKFQKGNKQLILAKKGECEVPTRLYNPIFTPLKQMGDCGIGFGLYFATLRAITLLTFLCGIIQIPNLMFFSSAEYSSEQPDIPLLLQGSAICTKMEWVPCPNCTRDDFEDNRLAINTTFDETTGEEVVRFFALKNLCDGATLEQGFVSYGTLFFFIFGMIALNIYLSHMEVYFNEDEQTARDYSIVVVNPPPDATDPEEWRRFFADNFVDAVVTTCTVAVDNDLLVRTLVERREKMKLLESKLEPGTPLNTLALSSIAAKTERERGWLVGVVSIVIPGIPELFARLASLNVKVQGLAQQDYPASNVFIAFETEAAQRRVLSILSTGSLKAKRNDKSAVPDPKYLFRGEHVLLIAEPDEPSTVRWQDLNTRFLVKFKERCFTLLVTIGLIAVIAYIITILNEYSRIFATFAIAISNLCFPDVAKFLTHFESHASAGGKQTSLYFKIAASRWVNTAVVFTLITPFTDTITNENGLIGAVYGVFFAEIVTVNIMQLGDPWQNFRRHVLAPRAASQDGMNLHMRGYDVDLAERYTNMTKILFLTLWYFSIFPGAFFLCSFAFFVNFFTDRFSLFRTWKPSPQLGNRLSNFGRSYFFAFIVVIMAVVSGLFISGYPYDNLCDDANSIVDPSYVGTWIVEPLESSGSLLQPAVVDTGDPNFLYCSQDYIRDFWTSEGGEWMSKEQDTVTTTYGWTSLAIIFGVALAFLFRWAKMVRALYRSSYKPRGRDQGINFSEVPSITTYIPQVRSKVFSYPLVACNADGIDPSLFEWANPDRPHSFYDLTKDADKLLRGLDIGNKVVFSQIRHWPAQSKKKSRKSKVETMVSSRRVRELPKVHLLPTLSIDS